ncbi:MAG: glycosyltransferase family 2 protein [Endomicrobia bacterium]|nr:glycosyltransferase family 2 protein [Endomicrobiia bacterium]
MKVSIIVPVYNEEKTILDIIEKIKKVDLGVEKEIIIVDDGSTDNTLEILKKIKLNSGFKIIFHHTNKGKGAAIRTGIKESSGDIIAIQDADLEYNPKELKNLISQIIAKKSLVVYGSRFLKRNPVLYRKYYLGNKLISWLISVLFSHKVTDSYTCYKVFHREVLKNINLESNRFEIEAELTCKFLKKGYKILELPISYNPRSIKQGKKIKFKDAILGIYTVFKIKFLG